MSIATFTELKTAIGDWLNRDDLASAVPSFIALAEARFNRELRTWKQETRSTAQLDVQYSALPPDFAQPIRLQLTGGATSEVAPISTAQLIQMRADRADEAGRPAYYAITAQGLELFPTPDGEYDASLVYFAKIPALSDLAPTNWLLTDAPDIYLYGALLHSAPYLKDDARVVIWESLHAAAIAALNAQSQEAKYGGSGLVIKSRRGMP